MKCKTKSYYNYAKKILEGDLEYANTELVSPTKTDLTVIGEEVKPTVDHTFMKLAASAGAGAVGAIAFIKYLDSVFKLSNIKSFARSISGWGANVLYNAPPSATALKYRDMINNCSQAIYTAIMWVHDKLFNLNYESRWLGFAKKAKFLGNTIGSSKYTYGTVLSVATMGAVIGGIIYGIYRLVKRMCTNRTVENYYNHARNIRLMKKRFNEGYLNVKLLVKLSESDNVNDSNTIPMAESLINKNTSKIDEMWDWATKTRKGRVAVGLGLIVSWLIAVIALCKGSTACWREIRQIISDYPRW